jgi:hypothetical protein
MGDRINVTLNGPAKIGDVYHLGGTVVLVTKGELADLCAAGVVACQDAEIVLPAGDVAMIGQADLDAAIAAQAAIIAASSVDAAVAAALNAQEASALQAIMDAGAAAEDLRELLAVERQNSADLTESLTAARAEIDALNAAQKNTAAAKTTLKKGAAAS